LGSTGVKNKRKWFSLGQRRCYCGRQLVWNPNLPNSATFEHLVPKSAGGTYHFFNSLLVCSDCNHRRGNTCWIKWINKLNPPKKEWLIQRYVDAVQEYRKMDRQVQIRYKTVNVYIQNMTINKG